MNRLYHVRSLLKRSIHVDCYQRCSSSPKCDFSSVEHLPGGWYWARSYSSRAKNVSPTDKEQDSSTDVVSQLESSKKGSLKVTSSKWIDVYGYLTSLKEPPSASMSVALLKKLPKLKPKPALKKKRKTCDHIYFSGRLLLCNPPIRIYKKYYYMPKETKYRLKKSITASDIRKRLFQEPNSSDRKVSAKRKSQDKPTSDEKNKNSYVTSKWFDVYNRSLTWLEKLLNLNPKPTPNFEPEPEPEPEPEIKKKTCFIEFSGSSKTNPGLAGAGAVLRTQNGRVICKLRQGLGIATSNVAEYRGLILGLEYAITKGYNRIGVMGDSLLVCNQVKGLWKVKNKELSELHKEVKELIMSNKSTTFKICYQPKEYISDAHAQATLGTHLCEGQVKQVWGLRKT